MFNHYAGNWGNLLPGKVRAFNMADSKRKY